MKNLDMVKVRLVPDYKLHSETSITSSSEALEVLKEELSQFDREAICVLNLNAKARPINASIVAIGDVTSATIHPRELFKCAILSSANGIILIHNHPSGELTPSQDDILVTSRLLAGAKLLGIKLVDHIIIGLNSEYVSMKENGMLEAMERASNPDIELLEGQNQEVTNFEIRRNIEGSEKSIRLTRDEVCQAYFEQQREFDRETVIGYLEEIEANPRDAQIFKLKYDISVKKVLSSEKTVQQLSAEFRRQKNKQGMDESYLLEEVLEKELAELPRRKRKTKEQER